MIMQHYGEDLTSLEAFDLYRHTFYSNDFYNWYMTSHNLSEDITHIVYSCLAYAVEKYFSGYEAQEIDTTIDKIKYSYIKRQIPVIMHGQFPSASNRIANTVVVRGYVDDNLIVNDPRGNANSGYMDGYGSMVIYAESDLERWISEFGKVSLLRISRKNMTGSQTH